MFLCVLVFKAAHLYLVYITTIVYSIAALNLSDCALFNVLLFCV